MNNNQRYMYGSTAEKIEECQQDKKRNHYSKARRKKEIHLVKEKKESNSNFIQTTMLAFVIVITLATLATLIKVQFMVSDQANYIIELQHDLVKVKKENLKLESDIERSVDMNKVYAVATEELGMTQPKEENIRYISASDHPYTVQYNSIEKSDDQVRFDVEDFLGFISEGWW